MPLSGKRVCAHFTLPFTRVFFREGSSLQTVAALSATLENLKGSYSMYFCAVMCAADVILLISVF
ncbi:hypothetical protein DPX39_010030800 [Trypanosoma brucei equiperdum]|uniref:Uncharacterized protein n=1 Tax=Trypanosoma brucei equiperdum TaxID=630700 RepID=A0A3L6LEX6_9TRYP|nr:hypothetical protein DPX39_010030800 [Trypanosoma brucei equiperdum]